MDDIMVSVICITYNHESLIEDAIKGVLKQKTNFKVEMIIHDDASTDSTVEVIKRYQQKYPEIIVPIYQKENQLSKEVPILPQFIFPLVRGKYIAFCEGDDYWIDELKLQKQIDFLESHEDFTMSLHNAVKLNCKTGDEKILDTFPSSGCYSQEEQIKSGLCSDFPAAASYVMRTIILKQMPSCFWDAAVGDYPMRQWCAVCGKIYYFADVMSVYRVFTAGSFMTNIAVNQKAYARYTIRMIKFYSMLNEYTNRKFESLLKKKIASDCYGYCISVPREEGMNQALQYGIDLYNLDRYYSYTDENYIAQEINEIKLSSDEMFIYGTSRLASVCVKQLEKKQIEFGGFVVSDSQMKLDEFENKPVYYLSELKKKFVNPGIILAVQPINQNIIINNLKKLNLNNYCIPYIE